eukprot:gene9722-6810_t
MEVLVNIHARQRPRGMSPSCRDLLVAGTTHAIITYGISACWDSAGAMAQHLLEKLWGLAAAVIIDAGLSRATYYSLMQAHDRLPSTPPSLSTAVWWGSLLCEK